MTYTNPILIAIGKHNADDTLNSAITQLVNYNKEINFFNDNIVELMKQRDKLMEDIDFIMSK